MTDESSKSQIRGHAYLVGFGIWIRDYETGRSYAYDMRDIRSHRLLVGDDAEKFRTELDEASRRAFSKQA